jgi:hypothetical protein
MNKNALMQYSKERLLEGKQTFVHVSDSLKKPTIGGKIEPLGFQRVGHESGHPRITWLGHLVVPSRMGKYQFQHVLLHLEE